MTNESTLITDIDNDRVNNSEIKSYPLFVADQVLTANHLNRVRDYLEQQIRFTRNKLLGNGIVCGLELSKENNKIILSKGTGITSEGFLALLDEDKTFTYYKHYELPDEFAQRYASLYADWKPLELLTREQAERLEDVEVLQLSNAVLEDKVVVLFLELQEQSLKNCAEMNCENKGDKVVFTTKVLLIPNDDVKAYFSKSALYQLEAITSLDELHLERGVILPEELLSTSGLINYFKKFTGGSSLERLSKMLEYSFNEFTDILGNTIPSSARNANFLKNKLKEIDDVPPQHIQYFKDWIEDLMMACNEFYEKAFDALQTECCAEENAFPIHLFLGSADKSTEPFTQTPLRNEFIASPLFHQQNNSKKELSMLLKRIYRMIEDFSVKDALLKIKITPSTHSDRKLGERCIPFYYQNSNLYQVWNWEKTRRRKQQTNLSYHSDTYASNDDHRTLQPLNYDLESFNFLRIEGHVGRYIEDAFEEIDELRRNKNLPFDLVALSSTSISRFFNAENHFAYFEDLNSVYEMLAADMNCKFNIFLEKACKIVIFESDVLTDTDGKLGGLTPKQVAAYFENAQEPAKAKAAAKKSKSTQMGNRNTIYEEIKSESKKLVNDNVYYDGGPSSIYLKKNTYYSLQKEKMDPGWYDATLTIQKNLAIIAAKNIYLIQAAYSSEKEKTNPKRKITLGDTLSFLLDNDYTFTNLELSDKINSLSDFNAKFNLKEALGLTVNLIQSLHVLLEVFENRRGRGWVVDDFENVEELLEVISFDVEEIYYMLQWLKLPKISVQNPNKKNLYDSGFYQFAKETANFLSMCMHTKFASLFDEYNRRAYELSYLTTFENYYLRHSGMEHKAGVTKGGTFILVYDGDLPDEEDTAKKITGIMNGMVIADFYIPYQHCSNSPSLSFIVSNQVDREEY